MLTLSYTPDIVRNQKVRHVIKCNKMHGLCFVFWTFVGKELGATFVSFDELLHQSDFVFVCCPLSAETKHLFDKNAFGKMKRSSVFINIARGGKYQLFVHLITVCLSRFCLIFFLGVVQQDDLVDALKNGTIFAAGLDVMDPEPLPPNHILTQLPNCGESQCN